MITDELAVADAHPLGARPFARAQYEAKFATMADGVIDVADQQRFLTAARGLAELGSDGLDALVPRVLPVVLDKAPTIGSGIF